MRSDGKVAGPAGRVLWVTLDRGFAANLSPMQEADRARALADLQAEASVTPILPSHAVAGEAVASDAGPESQGYGLRLSVAENRLVFDVRRADDATLVVHALALGPFRSLLRDYRLLVASHEAAAEAGHEARLQAIDMGRRGLHDEGARLVMSRLDGKIGIDFTTARRLFTLICVLRDRI
jgi:uncharacterized protein (UPF0262 family)